ncbi:MAG: hypothetical protein KJ890_15495 [Gammaproteobacteria bacterium]|nr:hypothetical protein [Gammaproteobacteria bacterium]MBU0801660.1 hypothetical protein [Alphaproteobacteria bacterium]MBU1803833.1 hypothetical protein [Gammaproteobacteria bacterium]
MTPCTEPLHDHHDGCPSSTVTPELTDEQCDVLNQERFKELTSFVVDDALAEHPVSAIKDRRDVTYVGFDAGFEPMFVGVISYLPGCVVDAGEACEIAIDLLLEKKWFANEADTAPSVVLYPPAKL